MLKASLTTIGLAVLLAGCAAVGPDHQTPAVALDERFINAGGSGVNSAAPGEDILSTLPTHSVYVTETEGKDTGYDSMDGTSMASPYVAGLAALIRSQFPTMPASLVKSRIEKSADDLGEPGFDDHYGYGRINAARAILGK